MEGEGVGDREWATGKKRQGRRDREGEGVTGGGRRSEIDREKKGGMERETVQRDR
jgi:hypothetical protein